VIRLVRRIVKMVIIWRLIDEIRRRL